MATMKFTKSAIEKLSAPDPSGKQTIYWAEGTATPGLGILVSGTSTSKSWVCQANLHGRARRITLGPVAVLGLEEAWEEAKPKLAAMLKGEDPKLTVPQRKLAAMTVSDVLDDYLKASSNLRPTTTAMYKAAAKHFGPLLNRTMRDISADEAERQFQAITADVAARRERGEIQGGVNVTGRAIANNAMRLFGSLWTFQAERDKGLGANPVQGRSFRRQWHHLDRRTRHIPADKLAEFYAAARKLPSDIQRDLVLVGLFTGMREGEASALQWAEVDLTDKMLRLPGGRMKAKKPFDLPMTDLVHQNLGHAPSHRSGRAVRVPRAWEIRALRELQLRVVADRRGDGDHDQPARPAPHLRLDRGDVRDAARRAQDADRPQHGVRRDRRLRPTVAVGFSQGGAEGRRSIQGTVRHHRTGRRKRGADRVVNVHPSPTHVLLASEDRRFSHGKPPCHLCRFAILFAGRRALIFCSRPLPLRYSHACHASSCAPMPWLSAFRLG